MKQNYTSKTDKVIRIVLLIAVPVIIALIWYTKHLYNIGQFGQ